MANRTKGNVKGVTEGLDEKTRKTSANASTEGPASDRSTETETNGGTRSSPPRVGGSGSGEAKGEKARSAAVARQNVVEPNDGSDSASS